MRHRHYCTALLLLITPSLGWSEAYRWVDENGRVHYTQTPPPSGEYGRVAPAPPPSGSSPNLDQLRDYNDAADKGRLKERQQTQKKAEEQARQQQRCTQAKQRLALFESGGQFYSMDEKGERTFLNSQQVDQRRMDARTSVDERCH